MPLVDKQELWAFAFVAAVAFALGYAVGQDVVPWVAAGLLLVFILAAATSEQRRPLPPVTDRTEPEPPPAPASGFGSYL